MLLSPSGDMWRLRLEDALPEAVVGSGGGSCSLAENGLGCFFHDCAVFPVGSRQSAVVFVCGQRLRNRVHLVFLLSNESRK